MNLRRLGGLDAAFLAAENEANHMHMMAIMLLEKDTIPGGYRFEKVRDFIAERLHVVPPLRRRLIQVPFGIARPLWIEDPDIDIERHIRRAAVPSPGGPREVAAMAAEMNSRPLDHAHPLWEMVIVEGLSNGNIALLAKLHHAMMDGMAGMQYMASLVSPKPAARPPPPLEDDRRPRVPGPVELLVRAMPTVASRPLKLARFAGHTLQEAIKQSLRTGVDELPDPQPVQRCALNARITPERSAAYTSLRLDDVKAIGAAFSATVNEVVLALVGGAVRDHLLALGESVEVPLVAGIPASTHEEGGDDQANAYAIMFGSLATHISDPRERLREICRSSRIEKKRDRLLWGQALAELTEIPSSLFFTLVARAYMSLGIADHLTPFCNLIVSNVPGPPIPIYFAGARIRNLYALGPIFDGVTLNLTAISVSGSLDVGLSACRKMFPDLWGLASGLSDSLEELKALIPQSPNPAAEDTSSPAQ